MSQLSCYFDAPLEPFRVNGGIPAATLEVKTDCFLRWDDGTVETVHATAGGAGVPITTVAGGSTFDGLHDVWLAISYKGAGGQIWLVQESQFLSIDHILSTSPFTTSEKRWAPLARIRGIRAVDFQQAPQVDDTFLHIDPAAGAPQDGDMLVFMAGTWELIHVPSGAADPGYTYDLDWNGTSPPNWRQVVNWKNRAAPGIGATHGICTGGTVNGQATNGAINLTISGTIAATTDTLVADITYASPYLTNPTVVVSAQQYAPHIVYHASVTNTGFSLWVCNPTAATTTPASTLIINYIIIPT
jgi:hypothetical protein